MSAYMVERHHIGYLVEAAFSRRLGIDAYIKSIISEQDTRAARVKLANMLSEANAASIAERYPDTADNPSDAPGDLETFEPWSVQELDGMTWQTTDPVQVIKAAHCYEYQASESSDWETMKAHDVIRQIISAACHALPGYDAAEWGAPEPAVGVIRLIG